MLNCAPVSGVILKAGAWFYIGGLPVYPPKGRQRTTKWKIEIYLVVSLVDGEPVESGKQEIEKIYQSNKWAEKNHLL